MKLQVLAIVAVLAAFSAGAATAQETIVEQVPVPGTSEPVTGRPQPRTSGTPYYEGTYYAGTMSAASWHQGYYYTAWGKPAALVVPPVAGYQTHWGWGVCNTRVTPINPQFSGPMNAYPYSGLEGFRPTPYWPWDTDQFGVYYIRGPW